MSSIVDLSEGHDDYRKAVEAAEEKALAEQQQALIGETPPVEERAERPRGPDGRFVAPEGEMPPVEEGEQAEAGEAPAEQQLILGKFRSHEDLERAYAELEQHAGGLRQEIGDLRQMFDERIPVPGQQQAQMQPTDWDTLIDSDPAQAVELAYENGDQYHWQQAVQAWNELAPGSPRLWVQLMQEREARKALEERFGPVRQQTEDQEWGYRFQQLKQAHPDFDNYLTKMSEIAGSDRGAIARETLNSGNPAAKAHAMETLYALAKLEEGDNLAVAQQQVAANQAQQSDQAVQGAFVAPTSTVSANTPKTWQETEQEAAISRYNRNADIWAGAFERPSKS